MGMVVGGALLGLGLASSMGKNTGTLQLATEVHSSMAPSKPTTPEAPVSAMPVPAGDTSAAMTANALMEAERERERQKALLRSQQAPEVFTSGLGASGLAATAKKSLLGG